MEIKSSECSNSSEMRRKKEAGRERDRLDTKYDALPLRFSSDMKLINAPSCKMTYELDHVVRGCMGRELIGIWEERMCVRRQTAPKELCRV